MFSMEDRRRAVDLYFTESMTIRKVVAKLGYPSEGALAKWLREDPRYTGACRRSYTLECKTNAARRALEGEPLARVARDAGCTPTSVYQWMRRYRSEGILGLMNGRNAPMPAEPMPTAGDDVEELRRQVEALRLENAVFLVKSVFRVSSLIFFGFRHEECRPVVCFTGCPSCRT